MVHDHTSVLATIEAKWNLPALTTATPVYAALMAVSEPFAVACSVAQESREPGNGSPRLALTARLMVEVG